MSKLLCVCVYVCLFVCVCVCVYLNDRGQPIGHKWRETTGNLPWKTYQIHIKMIKYRPMRNFHDSWAPLHKTFCQTFFCHKKTLAKYLCKLQWNFFFCRSFLIFAVKNSGKKFYATGPWSVRKWKQSHILEYGMQGTQMIVIMMLRICFLSKNENV